MKQKKEKETKEIFTVFDDVDDVESTGWLLVAIGFIILVILIF